MESLSTSIDAPNLVLWNQHRCPRVFAKTSTNDMQTAIDAILGPETKGLSATNVTGNSRFLKPRHSVWFGRFHELLDVPKANVPRGLFVYGWLVIVLAIVGMATLLHLHPGLLRINAQRGVPQRPPWALLFSSDLELHQSDFW